MPEDTDICIALDLDEVLIPGWREALEKVWTSSTTICRYKYVFNWEDEAMTIPRLTLPGFKIHARNAYTWRYPIHECLEPLTPEVEIFTDEVQINHYPDLHKARPYQCMLDYAVLDDPSCQRMSHLRGRELFMHERYEEAILELKRHLTITSPYIESFPGESQTRAMTLRLIGRSIVALRGNPDDVVNCMLMAVGEAPYTRENWVWLAEAWMLVGNYPSAYACAINAQNCNDRNMSIECEEICWGDYPQQLAAKALKFITTH